MSLNWVMLHDRLDFTPLQGEKPVYKSPPRTSLALTTPHTYPANNPVSIHCDSGTVFLTNQRVVYLPAKPTEQFKSFSAPLLNLHDTHVTVPWFGPNAWQALVQPVPGGNLPASSTGIELKITFKEGGAPDFHSNFERIKERLQQVIEVARENGVPGATRGSLVGVDIDSVHLDQLPSYEASAQDRVATGEDTVVPPNVNTTNARSINAQSMPSNAGGPPSDAPPGYEETQHQSIQQEIDRRLSNS